MSKSFKYVSDFSFPADCGFTGSAGKTSVKGYSRGGPMQKAAGGKVGANRPVQQAAVKPAPQQPNQPSPRMQPPGPQRPNQPPPRMQPPGPQRPNQPPPRMQPPAAPPPPQAAVKPAPQQPNQPMPQVMPRVEQQSPLTQVAQNAQPQRPNQPMPQVQPPMPQVQQPLFKEPEKSPFNNPSMPNGAPNLFYRDPSVVGHPFLMGGQMGEWGKNNPNNPFMPNDAPNPFYNGPPVGGQFGIPYAGTGGPGAPPPPPGTRPTADQSAGNELFMQSLWGRPQPFDQQQPMPQMPRNPWDDGRGRTMIGAPPPPPGTRPTPFNDGTFNPNDMPQPSQNPFNVIGGLGGMLGNGPAQNNPMSQLFGQAQQQGMFGPQQTQQPLQPPQPNQAQQSPMGPVGGLQQLQGQQAQPAPQQASLQPQTPPTLAPTAMKRGGGVKAPMKKADGGMIERESVRFIPMSDTAKFSKAIGRGSLPSMIRGIARDMALSGFEEEGRLALDEARAARASQLTEERAPPRARSQGLRSPVAEMARERALMGENAGYKKGGMAMRKQYPTNRSEPMIAMKKGGAAPKSDMLFSKKEVNATNLLRDGKGAPMPHPKGSVNMAKGGMTAKRQAKK